MTGKALKSGHVTAHEALRECVKALDQWAHDSDCAVAHWRRSDSNCKQPPCDCNIAEVLDLAASVFDERAVESSVEVESLRAQLTTVTKELGEERALLGQYQEAAKGFGHADDPPSPPDLWDAASLFHRLESDLAESTRLLAKCVTALENIELSTPDEMNLSEIREYAHVWAAVGKAALPPESP